MAEVDPFETSYAEHVPHLNEAKSRMAAKRLRKEALGRGQRARQEFEAKAPDWKNEPSAKTHEAPKGSSTEFHTGSYSGGLHFNLKKEGRAY